jgi:hypothetical protein
MKESTGRAVVTEYHQSLPPGVFADSPRVEKHPGT